MIKVKSPKAGLIYQIKGLTLDQVLDWKVIK